MGLQPFDVLHKALHLNAIPSNLSSIQVSEGLLWSDSYRLHVVHLPLSVLLAPLTLCTCQIRLLDLLLGSFCLLANCLLLEPIRISQRALHKQIWGLVSLKRVSVVATEQR